MIVQILFWTFLGSVASLIGGILLALRKKPFSHKQSMLIISFAAGVILSTALFDLFPEALAAFESQGNTDLLWVWTLAGIVSLFLLEKSLVWYHHHHEEHAHAKAVPIMVTVGDTIHNVIDGIVIAASFLADTRLGIVTAIAVAAHEIPHEMGDFGIVLTKGWSRKKAILLNLASSCASFLGTIGVLYFRQASEQLLPIFLGFSAGSFLYLACSDLIPELHHDCEREAHTQNFSQIIVFSLGIFVVWGLIYLLER
ncbi:MAG TPA: ZIP family metal transporter [Patescibacteria group bacterium]|nr:ZIP family metal transporter [Patescibacteria group bacterium]